VISSWFFLSTLNYDARSTTHQIYFITGHIVGTAHLYKYRPPVRVALSVNVTRVEGITQYLSTYASVETVFSGLVRTGEADRCVVCGQSGIASYCTSSGQLHESWERDCNDQANICPLYLGMNVCRIKQSRKRVFMSACVLLLTHLANTPVVGTRLKKSSRRFVSMMGKASSTQGSDWRFVHNFDPKILEGKSPL